MDAFEHLLEARDLTLQMLRACGRDLIGAHAAIGGRELPLCFKQTLFQQALQCGVERAFFYLEQLDRKSVV